MSHTNLGLVASGQNKVSGTTLAVVFNQDIQIGTVLVIGVVHDNHASTTASTLTAPTIGGATPTARLAATGSGVTTTAGAGIWLRWYDVTTTALITSGTSVTFTFGSAVVAKAIGILGITGISTTARGTVSANASTAGTPSSATTGTAPVAGDVVVGIAGFESNTATADSDTLNGAWDTAATIGTSGSSAATNVFLLMQAKDVSAGGAQTFNPVGANDSIASTITYLLAPPIAKPVSDTGTFSATDTSSVVQTSSKPVSDSGTFSVTDTSSVVKTTPPPEPTVVYSDGTTFGSNSMTHSTGAFSAAIDDLVIFVPMSEGFGRTVTSATVSANVSGWTALTASDTGTRVYYGRVTSAGAVSATANYDTSANTIATLTVVRGADLSTAPVIKHNIHAVLDNGGYNENTSFDYGLELVYSNDDGGQGTTHSTDYGTRTSINAYGVGLNTVSWSKMTNRPTAGTAYTNSIPGYFLATTAFFGVEVKPADPTATRYYDTSWSTAGTLGTNVQYKDITVPNVNTGDLVIAGSISANSNGAGTPAIATQSGSTGSWTVGSNNNLNGTPGYAIGHAQATGSGNVVVRVTVAASSGTIPSGVAVWVVPAGQWSGTPSYTANSNVHDADGKLSATASSTSHVMYMGADWTAANPGTTISPSTNGIVDDSYFDGTQYGVLTAHWKDQAAGTVAYGPAAPLGNDFSGAVVVVPKTGSTSTPVTVTDTGTFSATDTSSVAVTSDSKPVADTGTLSVTDTSANASTLSRTDTGTFSATDTSSNASSLDRTDAGTFSAADVSGLTVTLAVSDTGTFSATDTSSLLIAAAVSVTDSGTFSTTDTSALAGTSSNVDSGIFSAIEVSAPAVSTANTDSGTFSATDTSANASTLARTDTGTFSINEVVTIAVVLAANDTGTFSVTDASNVVITSNAISVSDSGTFYVTDTSANAGALARADTGTFSITDVSANQSTLSVSDTGTASVTEAVTQANNIALTDTGTFSVTESVATTVGLPTTDTGTFSVTEVSAGSGTGALIDTGTFSATDVSAIQVTYSVNDTGAVSATEGLTDIQTFGLVTKAASDTGTFSATDTSSMQQSLAVSVTDTGTFSATEARSIASTTATTDSGIFMGIETIANAASSSRVDSGTFSATDGATVFNDRPGADTGTFSITDVSSVAISGLILITASDSGTFSAADTVTQRAAFIPVTDSGTVSATDASSSALSSVRTDTGTVSATETSTVFRPVALTDTGTISATEGATITVFTGVAVRVWGGTSFVTGTLHWFDGVTMTSPPTKAWDGTQFVSV